ncbi:hypothetical protein B0H14DRAFT_3442529 [Mycena olivaceomarginata]|nr:hypothetical protein B0H14DRAFT_3442529 [Mycena olivaceomarginata]
MEAMPLHPTAPSLQLVKLYHKKKMSTENSSHVAAAMISCTERPRNPKSLRAAEVQSPAQSEDIGMSALVPLTTENRKINNLYDPNLFPEHRGDWFRHSNVKIIQRDIRNVDNKLIAPSELREKPTEGTLFCAALSLKTYVWPESKTYHMYIERLKILDQGSGDPWSYPIPSAFPSTLS